MGRAGRGAAGGPNPNPHPNPHPHPSPSPSPSPNPNPNLVLTLTRHSRRTRPSRGMRSGQRSRARASLGGRSGHYPHMMAATTHTVWPPSRHATIQACHCSPYWVPGPRQRCRTAIPRCLSSYRRAMPRCLSPAHAPLFITPRHHQEMAIWSLREMVEKQGALKAGPSALAKPDGEPNPEPNPHPDPNPSPHPHPHPNFNPNPHPHPHLSHPPPSPSPSPLTFQSHPHRSPLTAHLSPFTLTRGVPAHGRRGAGGGGGAPSQVSE